MVLRRPSTFLGLVLLLLTPVSAAQKFYPDDPIQRDHDTLPIAEPARIEISPTYDVLEHTFAHKVEGHIPRAMNVNTLGEVPDSSWYTNRIGVSALSLEELARGPNRTGPPDSAGPLTIIAAKSSGITQGFTVRDRRGNVYFVKFDPEEHANLSTGADVVSTLFFHAIGYNVPENTIIYLRPDELRIDPSAQVSLSKGRKAPMDRKYLELLLEGVARRGDGAVRAVASLQIEGKAIGPFRFSGTRPDDANDIFPHEHRRELRGYRVFCAWLNHDDSRSFNTFDTFVSTGESGYVRHYLIDFGSTLGSGSNRRSQVAPQDPRAGNEYVIDLEYAWKVAYTLGLWNRPWAQVEYAYPMYPEIGRIEADFFEPDDWKPEYPNPAFLRMLPDDAFWAAQIVARFSDEAIRTIVKEGKYSDPEAERFLADILIKRRDKIVSTYFQHVNLLDGFRVVDSRLEFENLGEDWDLGRADDYEFEWFDFDNETETLGPRGEKGRTGGRSLAVPADSGSYLMVRIRTNAPGRPSWAQSVDVYLRRGEPTVIVGIEREISKSIEER